MREALADPKENIEEIGVVMSDEFEQDDDSASGASLPRSPSAMCGTDSIPPHSRPILSCQVRPVCGAVTRRPMALFDTDSARGTQAAQPIQATRWLGFYGSAIYRCAALSTA